LPEFIHIVSFDIPFPANYGGIIDVYYKLVALKNAGVSVYLHCYQYGRKNSPELELLCEKVFYYPRKTGFLSNISLLPYNVKSRISGELEKNLLCDKHPILFEVLHTCYLLSDKRFTDRKKIFRHSNIEHEYFEELSKSERSFLKKIYLKIEASKLKRFESVLKFADLILAVNLKDAEYFRAKYPRVKTLYLPSFHPNSKVKIKSGKGKYILFHGNLAVSENNEAAVWLIKEVFSKLDVPCIIAGLNPPSFLKKLIAIYPHIQLVADPDETEMRALIEDAQLHILYTAQPTGLKLKLLNALFQGRFIICNANLLVGTDLKEDNSLFVCDHPSHFIEQAQKLFDIEFTEDLITSRASQLQKFDNDLNCKTLIASVF
jgi:hypothetical protein